jgi:23S rRNA pseudouridine2605 synthase
VRLAKYLAHAGLASRRASEEIIRAGRVRIDGVVVRDPARDVGDEHAVMVDGQPAVVPGQRRVYALHKPAGVVSTVRDPGGHPTVVSLVPVPGRLYPVGRLDADSTGLILLTDDGELAYRLTHPRFEVPKTYRAVLAGGPVSAAEARQLAGGVVLEDGPTAPAEVRRIGRDTLELTIHEGRKRQVRRMCEAVGHPVLRLQRVAFGPLALGDLPSGQHRLLSAAEVDRLRRAGGLDL